MDITFCTFYFDIDRKNWKHFTVSNEMYMCWFDNLLSLDINLFIVTEKKFINRILESRKKIDPQLKKTIINETTIEALTGYKLYNKKLEQLMYSNDFKSIIHHRDVPEMCKPLYNVLMFNKVHYLEEVLKINPFNTEYFSWVDAGFIRSSSEVENIEQWPDPSKLLLKKDKIKFFCINPNVFSDLKKDVNSAKYHLLSQMRFLKGTIFFLHKDLISPLKDKFDFYVNDSISKGFIGSDEKIFDLCCANNPDMFDLYQCNWREELKLFSRNYTKPSILEYTVSIEWKESDIEKSNDYRFWFFCIEDGNGKSIMREDFQISSEEDYQKYKNYKNTYKVISDRKPENFVIWPVSKSKGYLRYVRHPVKHIIN